MEEVRGDDPELASYLRIEERELEAGGLNYGKKLSPPLLARRSVQRTAGEWPFAVLRERVSPTGDYVLSGR